MYVITDGSRFIYCNHEGKFVPCKGEMMADKYTKRQAESILNNSISKSLRKGFRVEKCKYEETKEPGIKEVTQESIDMIIPKAENSKTTSVWINKINYLSKIVSEAEERKTVLNKELSNIEAELNDVNHYCEFQKLNAVEGYKAYKMIHEKRVNRRAIKDELQLVTAICDLLDKESCKTAKAKAENLNKRRYEPRKLNNLFDF